MHCRRELEPSREGHLRIQRAVDKRAADRKGFPGKQLVVWWSTVGREKKFARKCRQARFLSHRFPTKKCALHESVRLGFVSGAARDPKEPADLSVCLSVSPSVGWLVGQ